MFGVAFAAAGLSQALQDTLIPEGTTPIAAFSTSPTRTDPRINQTSASFAEMAPSGRLLEHTLLIVIWS